MAGAHTRVPGVARRGNVFVVALALAVAVTGCGSREEAVIADPVAEALAYAPADAAVLAVVATDTSAGLGAESARSGGAGLVRAQAQAAFREGLDLDGDDVRPLLGRPLVIWSTDGSAGTRFAAWVVRDEERLGELLEAKMGSRALSAAPGFGDFALYRLRDGGAYARRGPVIVSAPDLDSLRAALGRRQAGGEQWSPQLLRERGLGLPAGALARVMLDAQALVARRGGSAERIAWVAALERAAFTVTPEAGGVRVRARASTDAEALSPDDVPVAPGEEAPDTRGDGRIVLALRDPSQTLRFARSVVDLLDPSRLDGLRAAEMVLDRFGGVSVEEDFVGNLAGSATFTSDDGRELTLRADLENPKVTEDALRRLGKLGRLGGPLANLAGIDVGGIGVEERDGVSIITQGGTPLLAAAVMDGALVASTNPDADLLAAAGAPAEPPEAQAGALRATVDEQFVEGVLTGLGLPALAGSALVLDGPLVVTARGEGDRFDVELLLPIAG